MSSSAPGDVARVTDPDELAAFFSDDPRVHVYALGDLGEQFWPDSQWWRRGDAVVGFVRLPGEALRTIYAVATRDPAATLDLLADLCVHVRPGELLTGPLGMAERLARQRRIVWSARHVRHHLADRASVGAPDPRLVPLGPADIVRVQRLYDSDPGAAFFRASMLDDQTYVGIEDTAGVLVAVAGTHLISAAHGVAAIGAVYTAPSARGQGLGSAVTAGVVHRIGDRAHTIGLNVVEANTVATHLYERLGFEPVLVYEEAELA